MPAPLARTLRSLTVAERGIDTSADGIAAVEAWYQHSRARHWAGVQAPPVCSPTYRDWSWVLNLATPGMPVRRVWPAPAHWDAPGYWEGAPLSPFNVADPQPWQVPWGAGFSTGTAPAGVDADNGCLIDVTADGGEGWEILGLRKANAADVIGLSVRTRPAAPPAPPQPTGWAWLVALLTGKLPKQPEQPPARYQPGDYVAEAVHYRTPANSGRIEGRGAGRVPKRRGVITAAELDAGVIEHAISVTMMNFNHGPGGLCGWVEPASRCEHSDRAPNGSTAAVVGLKPGWTVRNGQGYAFEWADGARGREAWASMRGHTGRLRRTALILALAISTEGYGIEGVETCSSDPQAEASLTPQQWAAHGVSDARTCTTLLDGIEAYGRWVALLPAPVFVQ